MIPNYSNWLAKRLWAVNQTRQRLAKGTPNSRVTNDNIYRPSFRELEREARKQDALREEQQRKEQEKRKLEWLQDKSKAQQARDYNYLDLVLSGEILNNLSNDQNTFSSELSKVMGEFENICAKYDLDIEQYAKSKFPELFKETGDDSIPLKQKQQLVCSICGDSDTRIKCNGCGKAFCSKHNDSYMTKKVGTENYRGQGSNFSYDKKVKFFCPEHGQLCVDCVESSFLSKAKCKHCNMVLTVI